MNVNADLKHFKWWTVECISCLIVIFSYFDELTTSRHELSPRDYWIFYSSIVSIVISLIGLAVSLYPSERKVCSLESLLVWLIAILRSSTTIGGIVGRFHVDREITLLFDNQLLTYNPNVYFFSLWALMASILMVASWFKEFINKGNEWSASTQWILLGAMSFFTMLSALVFRDQIVFGEFATGAVIEHNISRSDFVASVDIRKAGNLTMSDWTAENVTEGSRTIWNLTNDFLADGQKTNVTNPADVTNPAETIFDALVEGGVMETLSSCEKSSYSCFRIQYAIGLSAVTAVISCFLAPAKGASQTFQIDVSIILFLLWICALPILTVSPGPATRAGNLYFGIYICYFLVLGIFLYSVTFRPSDKNDNNNDNKKTSDISEKERFSREDIWQAAYGKLDRKDSSQEYSTRDENDSYGSLFDQAELWDEDLENRLSKRISIDIEEYGFSSSGVSRRRLTRDSYASVYIKKLLPDDAVTDSSSERGGLLKPNEWKRRVGRLKMWFVLLTMAIVLTCTVAQYEATIGEKIVPSISIVISCIGIITCLRTSKVSNIFQTVSIIVALAIWLYGAVAFIHRHKSHILGFSVSEDEVSVLLGEQFERIDEDPNIFFCVWISVITAILLVTSGCKASLVTTDWLLFAIVSVALLISSSEFISEQEDMVGSESFFQSCDAESSSTCRKFTFARYLAIATLCVSLLMTLLFRFGPTLHIIVSLPLAIVWGIGVPYVTFFHAKSTPAAVYFAFWGGIYLSVEIASINIVMLRRKRRKAKEEASAENEKEDEMDLSKIKEESLKEDEIDDESLKEIEQSASVKYAESLQQSNTAWGHSFRSQENDDYNSGRSVESYLNDNQENDGRAKEEDSGDTSQSRRESFLDESHHEDEKSTQGILRGSSQIEIESNINDNQQQSETAKDSFKHDDNQEDQDHRLTEPNVIKHPSQSSIESHLDDNDQNDGKSVESDDFVDCSQFEVSSPRFFSARSAVES